MQKKLSIIVVVSILLNLFTYQSYALVYKETSKEDTLKLKEDISLEDARLFINNVEAPVSKYDNHSYIKLDILKNYGFNVEHNSAKKTVKIYEDIDLYLKPVSTINDSPGILIPCTDIRVQFINEEIAAFKNYKDEIFIDINEFYRASVSDSFYNDEEKALYIDTYKKDPIDRRPIDRYKKHPFKYPQIKNIALRIKDTDIFYKNRKIGFIQDDLEMISIKFILEQTDFTNSNSYKDNFSRSWYKDDFSRSWEFKDKYYRVVIWANIDSDIISTGSIYWKDNEIYRKAPLQKPIDSGDDVYFSSIDLMQFFNVSINYDNIKENAAGDWKDMSDGNCFSDSLFYKYNDDIYFIDGKNDYKLCRMKIDDGSSIPVTDFSIKNLILHDNKLYFIGTADRRGVYSIDLSSMKMKKIIDKEASYLSIVGDKLYFCNGLEAGWLYSASLEGRDTKLVIKRYMKYPIIKNGYVYYINGGDRNYICRYNLSSKRNYRLINNDVDSMNMDDKHIYFRVHKNIYKIKHNGLDEVYFDRAIGNDIVILKDNIYFKYEDKVDIVRKDGTEIHKDDMKFYGAGVIGDKVYILRDALKDGKPYLHEFESDMAQELDFSLEGEGNQIVSMSYPYIFYKDDANNLVKYDINEKESMIIVEKLFSTMIGIKDDWLFYIKWGNEGGIYKVKLDGSEDTQLTDKNVARVKLDDEGIYYLKSFTGSIEDFYSIDFNGENRKIIIDDLDQIHFTYEIKDGYIYYPQQKGIYRIKTNGENKRIVVENEGPIYQFIVDDNYLFYLDREIMYKVDLKDFNIKEAKDTINRILKIENENVYFVKETGKETGDLYVYSIKNDDVDYIISEFDAYDDIIGFYGNSFLYFEIGERENRIYSVDLKTKDKILISDKIIDIPVFDDKRLLYILDLGKLDLKAIEKKGRGKND